MKDFLYKLLLLLFFEHYMYDKVNSTKYIKQIKT